MSKKISGWVSHIERSVIAANCGMSFLTDEILNIDGMSSYKFRHFLNNMHQLPDLNYLEIGTYKGSTFISSMYQNKHNEVTCIDNWSEFHETAKDDFTFNTQFFGIKDFNQYNEDCFSFDKSKIKNKVNFFFYDGAHDEKSHIEALSYFYDILDDEFIYIVDDILMPTVLEGTKKGILFNNLDPLFEKYIPTIYPNCKYDWHNGLLVVILKKKK